MLFFVSKCKVKLSWFCITLYGLLWSILAILSDDEGEGMATGETTTDSVLPELSDDENDAAVRRDGQDGEYVD